MQEKEVPYLSPADYARLREPIQTGWKILGLTEGVWPQETSVEFQKLTASTTTGERLAGIQSGEWPFEWEEMLKRTPEQVADMRYREKTRGLAPIDSALLRAAVLGRSTINIEEFVPEVDRALIVKLLYPDMSS